MSFKEVLDKSDLGPGATRAVEINGEKLAIYNVNGKIFCTENTCPHAHGPLGEGFLEENVISCPLHGWTFNVETGEGMLMPGSKIRTYKIKVENNKIFVDI